jgi:hypothetical protein
MFDMGLVGLGEITEFFDACDKNEEKLLRKSMVGGAKITLKAAKANCDNFKYDPAYEKKKTYLGTYRLVKNLKKSLKLKAVRPKEPGKQLVLVGPEVGKRAKNDGWYGRLVENVHKTVKGRKRITYTKEWKHKGTKMYQRWENGDSKTEPHPFIRNAYDETVEAAFAEAAKIYNEGWGEKVIQDIEDIGDILMDGDE